MVYIFKISLIITIVFNIIYANNNPFQMDFLHIEKNEKTLLALLENKEIIRKKTKSKKQLYIEQLTNENKKLEEEIQMIVSQIQSKKKKELKRINREALKLERKKVKQIRKKKFLKIARKRLLVKIDISQQRMRIYKRQKLLYVWKISTGKKGYATPRGHYKPVYLERIHYSKKYNNASMPYSVFFSNGFAIHGTKSVSRLGRKASHGCIRLHTANARKFYRLVQKNGKHNTLIKIVN